jgi:hypothetical protein
MRIRRLAAASLVVAIPCASIAVVALWRASGQAVAADPDRFDGAPTEVRVAPDREGRDPVALIS